MGCKKSYTLLRIACLIGVRLLVPPLPAGAGKGWAAAAVLVMAAG